MNYEEIAKKLYERLKWYVEEDDTYEGGHWDEENSYWIEGKQEAEAVLEEYETLIK